METLDFIIQATEELNPSTMITASQLIAVLQRSQELEKEQNQKDHNEELGL